MAGKLGHLDDLGLWGLAWYHKCFFLSFQERVYIHVMNLLLEDKALNNEYVSLSNRPSFRKLNFEGMFGQLQWLSTRYLGINGTNNTNTLMFVLCYGKSCGTTYYTQF